MLSSSFSYIVPPFYAMAGPCFTSYVTVVTVTVSKFHINLWKLHIEVSFYFFSVFVQTVD